MFIIYLKIKKLETLVDKKDKIPLRELYTLVEYTDIKHVHNYHITIGLCVMNAMRMP